MNVHSDILHLPAFRNAVITIGTFDGVHTGHKQIIRQLRQEAEKVNGESVIITFDPHPRKVIGSPTSRNLKLINTPQEKAELLASEGIDHLVIVPFTAAFAAQSADAYVRHFLMEKFHPHTIIIGYDHRFGQGRLGDFKLLEQYGAELGFHLVEIPVHLLHEISVSSTNIRQAIEHCDMATANELLGYDFFFEGKVIEGNKLGRTLGFPTANLAMDNPEKIIPGNGVYAVLAEGKMNLHPDQEFVKKGMMNIGVRPTVGGTGLVIEVHLLDFNGDLYGQALRISVKRFLRAEQKFSGLEALKEQLERDQENASE